MGAFYLKKEVQGRLFWQNRIKGESMQPELMDKIFVPFFIRKEWQWRRAQFAQANHNAPSRQYTGAVMQDGDGIFSSVLSKFKGRRKILYFCSPCDKAKVLV